MNLERNKTELPLPPTRSHFAEDFRRFFLRGLAALMPTLITLWLLIKVWDFLWESLGQYIIWAISSIWFSLVRYGLVKPIEPAAIRWFFWAGDQPRWTTQLIGVLLAVLLVYIVGLFVGNLSGGPSGSWANGRCSRSRSSARFIPRSSR